MKTIETYNAINALKGDLSDALQRELDHYYRELALEMGEEAYQAFDLAGIAIIALFEAGDNIHHMPLLGMTKETITLLETIPEFIDEIILDDEIWYRLILILSADVGRVIYMAKALVPAELEDWINTWKEDTRG